MMWNMPLILLFWYSSPDFRKQMALIQTHGATHKE